MYYYYRPYQSSQVMELQGASVANEPGSLNVWDNRLFDLVAENYAGRHRDENAEQDHLFERKFARRLEFVGRPESASHSTLPAPAGRAATDSNGDEYFESESPSDYDFNSDFNSPTENSPEDESQVGRQWSNGGTSLTKLRIIDPAAISRTDARDSLR